MKCRIHNNANYVNIDKLIEDLYNFAHERFNFPKKATIVLESNIQGVNKVFEPTAHYSPNSHTVTVFVDHRHPKDILRSIAHELIHHDQNCRGEFNKPNNTSLGYAQDDPHLREMEIEAYKGGNIMLFRDWEDNYKKRNKIMSEAKETKQENTEPKEEIKTTKEEVQSPAVKERKVKNPYNKKPYPLAKHKEKIKSWYNGKLNSALMDRFIKK